jgi:hypothetical protein
MSQLTRSEIRKFLNETSSTKEEINEGMPDDAKKAIADWFRENAVSLSENFPYGTQTIAEKLIRSKADELANCIVDIVDPFK